MGIKECPYCKCTDVVALHCKECGSGWLYTRLYHTKKKGDRERLTCKCGKKYWLEDLLKNK
jgi:hypothetical protein